MNLQIRSALKRSPAARNALPFAIVALTLQMVFLGAFGVMAMSSEQGQVAHSPTPVGLNLSREFTPYFPMGGAVVVDDQIRVGGLNQSTLLYGAQVSITNGFRAGDKLGFLVDGVFSTDYFRDGISGSYASASGVLTLKGTATSSAYVSALRSIAFQTASPELGPRRIQVLLLGEAMASLGYNADTGHFYEYVAEPTSWENAHHSAGQRNLYGLQGYLATITSDSENATVTQVANNHNAWIGAAQHVDDHKAWSWVSGPEAGLQFRYDLGNVSSGEYENWNQRAPRGDTGRNRAYIQDSKMKPGKRGNWDDDYEATPYGYMVEYGGSPGDPPVKLVDYITVQLHAENVPPVAAFSFEPEIPRIGDSVIFSNASMDPNRSPLTYVWDFGDGTPPSTDQHPVHVYAAPGLYTVQLTVTGAGGLSDVVSQTIHVTGSLEQVVRGTVFVDDGEDGGIPNDGWHTGGERGVAAIRLRAINANGITVGSTLTDSQGHYTLVFSKGDVGSSVRLVLEGHRSFRPTGYTPGTGSTPVQLDAFGEQVDVPIAFEAGTSVYEGYDFGVVPALRATTTEPGTAPAGGVEIYPFKIILGTAGTVTFDLVTPRGWDYTVYHDKNGDGILNAGDAFISTSIGPIGPGETSFLLAARIPGQESDGAMDTASLRISFDYEGNPSLQENAEFPVTTTIRTARLQLIVEVRNITQSFPPGSDTFSRSQVEARVGDLLEYRIQYRNIGTEPVLNVVASAAIPHGTVLVGDAYGTDQAMKWVHHGNGEAQYPSVASRGPILSLQLGTVVPNAEGSFMYRVVVD